MTTNDGETTPPHLGAAVTQYLPETADWAGLVDALKASRRELAEVQQILADAQRLTKTGSWVIDPVGGGASCSAEGYRILGLPGKTSSAHYTECLANVHPDDLPGVLESFGECVRTGEARPLRYRIVSPIGETTDIETVAQPMTDDTGCVVRVVGTVMDVTERNRTQNALRTSEKLARGQLATLTQALDALVHEASPDRLPAVVLRAIAQEFDAFSITVWLTDDRTQRVGFAYQYIGGELLTAADSLHPAARLSIAEQDNPVWRRMLTTKRFEICSDVAASGSVPFREYNLSIGLRTVLVVPMLIAGHVAGLIAIGFDRRRELEPEEIELAQVLANQAMLGIQLTRLSEQSRRAAVTAERHRLMHDVHDTLAQAFTGVIVQLQAADDAAARGLVAEAGGHVARAEEMARTGLKEARRSVMALRPQALERSDVPTAVKELLSRLTAGTSITTEFSQRGATRSLSESGDEHLLRISQEALANSLRHSVARHIVVRFTFDVEQVQLEVTDDGRGFDDSASHSGFGLAGMKSRATSMGGQLVLHSGNGSGTTILVTVPYGQAPT